MLKKTLQLAGIAVATLAVSFVIAITPVGRAAARALGTWEYPVLILTSAQTFVNGAATTVTGLQTFTAANSHTGVETHTGNETFTAATITTGYLGTAVISANTTVAGSITTGALGSAILMNGATPVYYCVTSGIMGTGVLTTNPTDGMCATYKYIGLLAP